MKIFQFHLGQLNWINAKPILINGQPHQLNFQISESSVQGRFKFEKGGCSYHIDFELEEILLEGDWRKQQLILLFRGVPQVSAEGGFLQEIGSSLVNAIGKLVDLESILMASLIETPGLSVLGNDLMYEFQRGQAPIWLRLMLWAKVQLRIVPDSGKLRVEVHRRRC